MPSTTPTLSLSVYNDSTDGTELFSNFRADIAGDVVSNMTIIDDWADGVNTDISTLQLSQPINYVYATVTASPADYISTVAAIISYVTNMIIVLRLDIGNASSSTTLNINGLGSKNLMKYVAGSPVNINANDLRINKDYLFRYDGTRWVWVNAVSGDQLSVSGTSGDIIKISSVNGIETASTAITNLTLLLGRSGGQTISGGIVSDEILTLTGNSYGSGNTDTKPSIQFKVGDAPSTAATILNSGYLGLGTATPSTLLHIATSTTAAGSSTLEQASADADSFDIAFKKTRGTISSPTVITTGDELGTIQFSGYSGAGGYVVGAAIKSISSGTIATTRIPSQLSFWTGTDAAPTVLTERMTIKNDGKVGIATNAPSEMLHVVGNARVTGLTGGVVKTDANGLMSNIVLAGDTTKFLNENGVFSIAGHSIEDEGSAVTARATLNFVGAGVTVTDVSSKTTVTVPGAIGDPNTYVNNVIINGNFVVAQRGITFTSGTVPLNSDDTFLLDRWVLLSDGNDIVDVSQETTVVPTGSAASIKLDIETEDKKWGLLQIIEAKDSAALIGGNVSLSFKAARGAGDTNTLLRAGVLSWSSTDDAVTSDVINAWGAEGTNPTLVANWTFENTPAALAELTDAWQTYKIENIAIDTASTTNVAVFIWSDDMTNAVGDLVYITDVKLAVGVLATPFVPRPFGEELELCKRYYEKIQGVAYGRYGAGYSSQTNLAICHIGYVAKRVSPTVSCSDVAQFLVQFTSTSTATTNVVFSFAHANGVTMSATTAAVQTVGQGVGIMGANNTSHWIMVAAEL